MYNKALLLLVFVFSCLLTSCRSTRQEIHKTETKTELVSEKTISYKDTTLFAPKAETTLKLSVPELMFKANLNYDSKPIVYAQKNAQAQVKLKIVRDTIHITATCDSLALRAKIKTELQKQNLKVINNSDAQSIQKGGFSYLNLIIAFILGFAFCYLLKIFKVV